MINFNGNITSETDVVSFKNRGFNYGDAVFETIKFSAGKLLFFEDHYFRLMASMRIMRMEIPMHFTMEFLEEQILQTIEANKLSETSARVKLFVNRLAGGLYLPETNDVEYLISVSALDADFYLIHEDKYEVDLFKDYYISPSLLSTLKTNNKAIHVVGSIYAKENKLDNCLILNTDKQVVEALNGNLFLVKGNTIKTPPLTTGCLKGVMRKQIMEIITLMPDYTLVEEAISPFELQKADELFFTNVITGIQSITKYRKKEFHNSVAQDLVKKLNVKIRLSS
ncbi:branched-chain amino acid aminotransferase [Oceanihabitans sediminis]|uniref:branched-chain-amino-acid transaminase n=1 Tax=Oceanihabitans sediminis TaxID=1812012 RepID=A0A368P168_9FLAO|nr:aminotransferase class IV [Oceanihabitans sediminis]MDX1774512.1 aminotransferase class IV [Oceanihabitans sediminis]RBP27799.1 branched-chain amino acid aminotransferase [Oceanihabitans sediminis]RCU56582.1 aminotransferase class IV [Oceanihabitans sediminis]